MSKENDNKAIVGRWFEGFWGETFDPGIIDELAAPEMLLKYSLHEPRWVASSYFRSGRLVG